MKYCTKCGHQMEDDMLFCQKCGTKSEPIQTEQTVAPQPTKVSYVSPQQTYYVPTENTRTASRNKKAKIRTPTTQQENKKNGTRALGIMTLVLVAISLVATIGLNSGNDNSSSGNHKPSTPTNAPGSIPENAVVIDVEKYGNISGSELIAFLGEPDEISESTCEGAFDIPCVYYEYSSEDTLGEVSFVLVNDQVVRFTSYSEYPYESKNAVLAQFGITKESSCAVAADTSVALRYRCPSAKVDDFWINLIDGDTFGFLQVTYDMEYYEKWYLPLTSSEEVKYKTDAELTMKSLLTSPKTADFPWYDWEYGKNLFYILVSSYVDAENAFGVEMRNTFTFVYSRLTGSIVLAIVNDEIVANNGYVEVDELIQQLYDEMQKAKEDAAKEAPKEEAPKEASKENSPTQSPSSSPSAAETPIASVGKTPSSSSAVGVYKTTYSGITHSLTIYADGSVVHRNETMDFTVHQGTWSQNGSEVTFAIRFFDSDKIETYKSTLNTDGLQFIDLYFLYQSQPGSESANPEVAEEYNTIEQLETILRSSCDSFNAGGNKELEGTVSFNIKNTTEIELYYAVSEWVYSDTEYLVDVVQNEILDHVIEDLNAAELPETVVVSIYSSYSLSALDNSWDTGGDLDGIVC